VLVVDASGSPFDRGFAHGTAASDLIAGGMERWRASLEQYADGDVDAYLGRFMDETDFLVAIKRWAPELCDEVDGIADGASIDRRLMFAYQLMDEQWCYEFRKQHPELAHHHCSSIGVRRRGGGSIVAQNMDLPVHFDGTQVLVRTPEELLFTPAGLIVSTGMNVSGVGVCVNSLMDRPTAPNGLPVAFAIRGALARDTAADAADFLREIDHASGQNYLVGDPDELIDLEAGADGVDEFASDGVILHTNHSLTLDVPDPREHHEDSYARHAAITDVFDGVDEGDEEDVVAALSDLSAPVCRVRRPDKPWMTFGSVIFTLTEDPEARIAPGPPTVTRYERHSVL
jgi:isopenicillin-N N-acyltransferase like protein